MIDPETTPRHVVLVGAGTTRTIPLFDGPPARKEGEGAESYEERARVAALLKDATIEVERLSRVNLQKLLREDDRSAIVRCVRRVGNVSVTRADGTVADLGDPTIGPEERADLIDDAGLTYDVAARLMTVQRVTKAESDF
jgi:hypothetical protein